MALAILFFVVAGLVAVAKSFSGDEAATQPAADGSQPTSVSTNSSPAPVSSAVDPAASSTTAEQTTTTAGPKESFVPSKDRQAQLLIVGDSDAGTFGPYLQRLLKKTGLVNSTLDYKVSSGLARLDFFDWPNKLATDLAETRPDLVVITFGGNDAQGLTDANKKVLAPVPTGEGDETWREIYGSRVGAVMDMAMADNTTVIWVGIPNHIDAAVTKRMKVQDDVVRAEAAKRPNLRFVDTWALFSGGNGNYADFVIDPRDGEGKPVRAKDGFHLNETGAEILALKVYEQVAADLQARGATLPGATDAATAVTG